MEYKHNAVIFIFELEVSGAGWLHTVPRGAIPGPGEPFTQATPMRGRAVLSMKTPRAYFGSTAKGAQKHVPHLRPSIHVGGSNPRFGL